MPHQANGVMLGELLPRLKLTSARTHLTVAEHANTGAGSIPLTLDTAHRHGAFADGDLVLMAAFGGGMSTGATLVRWDANRS
ncbi:3-oxoacyl-[acyl-carrier-protein] synthase III C-terminal domain-containing protein [Phytohabitans flavus]|uniref:3-oxoacyl-[acyl-carrier-protein] synthase III C-terminal domain-containing protein n=1 Tax=Phytohabitans flavus TaxID=1076124 RepID=UPI001E2F0F34|nr:3-oxoacyl-[acyl-carrier-protein] synthase III C-terminal domain-containing protein [Phytohabitans flavus]